MTAIISSFAALAACTPGGSPGVDRHDLEPEYGSVTTKLLDGDLVSFDVQMLNASSDADVIAFTDCVAAQYALIRGAGFVRRVRNDVKHKRNAWMGTGVYTLSEAHPGGKFSIDAEITARECRTNDIPMV